MNVFRYIHTLTDKKEYVGVKAIIMSDNQKAEVMYVPT